MWTQVSGGPVPVTAKGNCFAASYLFRPVGLLRDPPRLGARTPGTPVGIDVGNLSVRARLNSRARFRVLTCPAYAGVMF